MDFIRLIRSLEELLYEGMTWLVFYPRTMVRIVAHPDAATRYSEDEQKDAAPRPSGSAASWARAVGRRSSSPPRPS